MLLGPARYFYNEFLEILRAKWLFVEGAKFARLKVTMAHVK